MNLTNDEAQLLIALQKKMKQIDLYIQPPGKVGVYPATDLENARTFLFRMRVANGNHVGRHKTSYNLFYNGYQLLRLDTYGNGMHTNSDGSTIPACTPHIHIYDENEVPQDHHAYPLPERFTDPEDDVKTLLQFLEYANVVDIQDLTVIQQGVMGDVYDIHR